MNKTKFINQLKKLVSFETVTGNVAENAKALDFIQNLISKKAVVKRVQNNGVEVLIASNTSSMKPDIAYLVHADVVSGQPKQFKLDLIKDKAYGRGASDMKFSIPMGVELLNMVISKNSKLTFAFVVTTDEENGGENGCGYLVKNLKFKPKCLIVPDGGDNVNFVNKAKGVCWIKVISKGIPSHASRPWMGKNAIEALVLLSKKLIDIYGKNSLRENWNTTMNIGQIHGGISTNQVCPEALMWLDFRYPESDSIKNILMTVKKTAKETNSKIKVVFDSGTLPTFTDSGLPIVQSFITSIKKAYGKKIIIAPTYGASDASHFAKQNIPVLMIKPVGGEIHSEDEWISIDSCMKFFDGLNIFITNLEKEIV